MRAVLPYGGARVIERQPPRRAANCTAGDLAPCDPNHTYDAIQYAIIHGVTRQRNPVASAAQFLRLGARGLATQILRAPAFLSGACVLGCLAAAPAYADNAQTVQLYADAFAQAVLTEGTAVGVGVGVAYKTEVFYTAGFGLAVGAGFAPFTPDSLFEIASNTKVFTTNLLGQAVNNGQLELGDQLSHFSKALGTLPMPTGMVTLEDLADFTGGFPLYAPICGSPTTPGCRPSGRPTILQYGATPFLDFFQHAVPKNFYNTPPTNVSPPAPYNYSDYSIGLLGCYWPIPTMHSTTPRSLGGSYRSPMRS
jgi:CubicO group peptidase (beta-lactamase class C family)